MSSPSTASFDVREDLSLLISEFDHSMNEQGYVGHRILPMMPRDKKSGKMPRIPLEQEMQDMETERNPDGTFKRTRMEWTDDNYDTQSHGLEVPLDDETQDRYDDLIDSEFYEGNRIERAILRRFEILTANYFTTPANYDSSRLVYDLTAWSTAASANPYGDIDAQREAMFTDLGAEPNALILTRKDFRDAMKTDAVLARITGQNFVDARPGNLARNATQLALALDIEYVIVANALKNTGQSRNLSRIWPNGKAVLAKVGVTDDPGEVCIGRTPIWSPRGAVDGDRLGIIAESYDEPQRAGTVLRRRANYGRKILHVEAARLLFVDGTSDPG